MFALYLPSRHVSSPAVLRELGAEWALDPSVSPMFVAVIEGGPDGGGGTLVYFDPPQAGQINRVDLSAQEWQPAAPDVDLAAGRYWLGVWKDKKPSPEDLQRQTIVDGAPLRLCDDKHWTIPVSEFAPKRLTLNRETGGEGAQQVLPRYRRFIEQTNAMFRHLVGDEFQGKLAETLRVVIPGGLVYSADALSINYRVNRDLVDMLGLVGEWEAIQIAGITTGLDLVEVAEAQKKRPLRVMQNCAC